MVDVASIAKKALDGVAAKLDGVIHLVTITQTTDPVYDAELGIATAGAPTVATARAVDESGSLSVVVKSSFPSYVVKGGERVLFLEGLSITPKNEDTVTSTTLQGGKIKAVQNILGVSQAYRVIVL